MKRNSEKLLSPWIYELERNRELIQLNSNVNTDITIIGGGISGILTAESLLRETNKTVIICEAKQIAHGATGHNAGQLTTYFERPIHSIVAEYGSEITYASLYEIEHAMDRLVALKEYYKIDVPIYQFEGYTGIQSREQMLYFIEQEKARISIGLIPWKIITVRDFLDECSIDSSLYDFIEIAEQQAILDMIESKNTAFKAVVVEQKGCTNSARFTEELVKKLLDIYTRRLVVYENSPIKEIDFREIVTIKTQNDFTIVCDEVVLCTNGFENFTIKSQRAVDINTYFHHSVRGLIGYMGAYTDSPVEKTTAISYLTNTVDPEDYYYLTRRPLRMDTNTIHNLISVGGLDKQLEEILEYDNAQKIDDTVSDEIEAFLRKNYTTASNIDFEFSFLWHGLMGFTRNQIRIVGRDILESRLLYNFGCNGVGILPAAISAPRIAAMVNKSALSPHIFDVK
jgi:glycine/D-amino acid oxidase-like deaminating enzyme